MDEDIDQWVIVELSSRGEKKDKHELEEVLQDRVDRDVEIFIPSTSFWKNDDCVTIWLMEGYIFFEAGHPASFYFDLEGSPYISKVLTRDDPSGRYLLYIDQEEIESLKSRLREQSMKNIEEGDQVEIKEGTYESLRGEVFDLPEDQEEVYVKVTELGALDEIIIEIPEAFLEKV